MAGYRVDFLWSEVIFLSGIIHDNLFYSFCRVQMARLLKGQRYMIINPM
jgi:hypothetical protein